MRQTIICLAGRKRTGKESVFKLLYQHVVDPHEFQFATPLKKHCIEVLGLTHAQCYGSDADRESPTRYTWSDIAEHIRLKYKKNLEDRLSARDVLQVVGTDLMRDQFYRNIWAEAGIRDAVGRATTCVYTDSRFINEVQAIVDLSAQNNFGPPLICRLYRETGLVDPHTSESALDSTDVCPNQRSIRPDDHLKLSQTGYKQVLTNLWQGNRPSTYYDFLIDNNSTLENLKNAVIFMLKTHKLFHEVNLS
jgi:hypothetical protein